MLLNNRIITTRLPLFPRNSFLGCYWRTLTVQLDSFRYILDTSQDVTYSSRQAAKRLGLLPTTLSNYIVAGKVPAPASVTTGDITVYLWTDVDIERVRELLPKIKNGRKTRYKKQSAETQSKKQKPQSKAVPHKKSKTKKP